MVPETVEPPAGEVMVVEGAVASFLIVTVTGDDTPTLFAASYALLCRVYDPSAICAVSQLNV